MSLFRKYQKYLDLNLKNEIMKYYGKYYKLLEDYYVLDYDER